MIVFLLSFFEKETYLWKIESLFNKKYYVNTIRQCDLSYMNSELRENNSLSIKINIY